MRLLELSIGDLKTDRMRRNFLQGAPCDAVADRFFAPDISGVLRLLD